MQLLLDHLGSLLIASAVILVLASAQLYGQRSSLEQTTSYATKIKALSFGEWVEDDLLSMGTNYGDNAYRFDIPAMDGDGNTPLFRFYSDSINVVTNDTLRLMTRYKLDHVATVVRGGRSIKLYQMDRATASKPVVDGAVAEPTEAEWALDGRSFSTLSAFKISILKQDGSIAATVDEGEFVKVDFSLVPQFPIEPEYLRELYWTTTLKVRPFWDYPGSS